VSVAGFSVMAQRRLRALGVLGAIGASERHLRLVMITNGLAVGVAGALAGAVLGFAAWFAYAPTLQQATGHVIDAANLPWWAFAIGVVFAIATSVLASRRPAKTMAAVPVVAALSGRTAPRCPASSCSRPASRASRSPAAYLGWKAAGASMRRSCWLAWSPPSSGSACSPR
jgi:putative ABC transport system permease protein